MSYPIASIHDALVAVVQVNAVALIILHTCICTKWRVRDLQMFGVPACQLEGKYCLLPFSSVGRSPSSCER